MRRSAVPRSATRWPCIRLRNKRTPQEVGLVSRTLCSGRMSFHPCAPARTPPAKSARSLGDYLRRQREATMATCRALAEVHPAALAVFEEVDEALGQKLSALIRDGSEGALTLTLAANTLPAPMAVRLAALECRRRRALPRRYRNLGRPPFVRLVRRVGGSRRIPGRRRSTPGQVVVSGDEAPWSARSRSPRAAAPSARCCSRSPPRSTARGCGWPRTPRPRCLPR